jgi:hypothetical protein
MSFYFNLPRNSDAANQDEHTTAKPGEAESPIDRMFSPFTADGKAKAPDGVRLIGKHLQTRYPQRLTVSNLQQIYFRDPIGFIPILEEVSPFFKSTVQTAAMLATNGEFQFEVRVDGVIAKDLSLLAEEFFENQPPSVGGVNQIVGTLLKETMFYSDGAAFQGVGYDGDDGSLGYDYIKPFSTNTTNLGVNKRGQEALYQRRSDGSVTELNMEHTFWLPNEPTLASPNGTYDMTSGLLEGISEIITSRDLRDGVRGAGSPIRVLRYDRDSLIKTAVETLGITIRAGKKIADFVKDQVLQLESYAKTRQQAETLVLSSDVGVENVQPADFRAVLPALESLNIRAAVSFGTHSNMLGFGDSTKSSLQYQMVAQRINYKREHIIRLLERFLEAHFLLQGKDVEAKIIAPEIHLTDELVKESTAQVRFLNELTKFAMGLTDRDTFSKSITGDFPKGTEVEGALEAILKVASTPGGNDKNGSSQANTTGGKPGKPPAK